MTSRRFVFDKTRHVRGASAKKQIGLGTLTNIVKEGGPRGQVIGGAADAGLEARREMAYEYASASRVIKMGKTEPPPWIHGWDNRPAAGTGKRWSWTPL